MHVLLTLVLSLGIATAATLNRETRQLCQEPKIDNLCIDNVLQAPLHFPHPLDNRKFLQCANGRRMFIVMCPEGEVYSQATTSCGTNQVSLTTAAPSNPCTADNIAKGNIFFPDFNDVTKFIECTRDGVPNILSCPHRLVYDASRQSCVLSATSGPTTPTTTTSTTTTTTRPPTTRPPTTTSTTTVRPPFVPVTPASGNPCTADAILNNQLFFPHPDPDRFFQCDLAGHVYVMQCPSKLVWNQKLGQCDTPYHLNIINGGFIG